METSGVPGNYRIPVRKGRGRKPAPRPGQQPRRWWAQVIVGYETAAPASDTSIRKVILKNVYVRAASHVSFIDHASICFCQHTPPVALEKTGPGKPPVPRAMWRGSGPSVQRAMFRQFRGLGWGPRKKKASLREDVFFERAINNSVVNLGKTCPPVATDGAVCQDAFVVYFICTKNSF